MAAKISFLGYIVETITEGSTIPMSTPRFLGLPIQITLLKFRSDVRYVEFQGCWQNDGLGIQYGGPDLTFSDAIRLVIPKNLGVGVGIRLVSVIVSEILPKNWGFGGHLEIQDDC